MTLSVQGKFVPLQATNKFYFEYMVLSIERENDEINEKNCSTY
jgi:hypothetical protein